MSANGQVHLYYGEGKGKTTAAVGLAVRAFGAGYEVLAVQFLKDGDSSEMTVLKNCLGIPVLAEKVTPHMSFSMTEKEKAETCECHTRIWQKAMDWVESGLSAADAGHSQTPNTGKSQTQAAGEAQMPGAGKKSPRGRILILDEIIGAVESGLFPEEKVIAFLDHRPADLEVVLTGRNPSPAILDRADYRSRIICDGHPYNNGTAAREGIEF